MGEGRCRRALGRRGGPGAVLQDGCVQGGKERQSAGSHEFLVILEPGTDLHLRLGEEVLVLAPQTALQLALRNVLVVVLPWHVLSSSEELFVPGHARCIVPRDAEVTWAIDIEDGSLSAQRAERARAARAGEEAEAPRGLSPPSLSTLLLRPLHRAAGPQGCCGLPGPRPRRERRPLPAEFSLDLRGLGPCPGSALRPLPASPSPGPRPCRAARRRPPTGARRRLF
ncbi:proline-rich protein 23D1-like [Pteropus medius]|uniref:proline-rich protein 23D1-like n=1 Tax=Pteropus vampyrus TaxID=132908 RepID=UPI00196B7A3F|nr:proline-rich protein 23D1-like [Pteropus giganteus]